MVYNSNLLCLIRNIRELCTGKSVMVNKNYDTVRTDKIKALCVINEHLRIHISLLKHIDTRLQVFITHINRNIYRRTAKKRQTSNTDGCTERVKVTVTVSHYDNVIGTNHVNGKLTCKRAGVNVRTLVHGLGSTSKMLRSGIRLINYLVTATLKRKVNCILCVKLTLGECILTARNTDRNGNRNTVTYTGISYLIKYIESSALAFLKIRRFKEHNVFIVIVGLDNAVNRSCPLLKLQVNLSYGIGKLLLNVLQNVLNVIDSNVCNGNALVKVFSLHFGKSGNIIQYKYVYRVTAFTVNGKALSAVKALTKFQNRILLANHIN